MSPKRTLIIAILFALLAGGYFLDQGRIEKKEAREEQESRLVTPVQADLSELQVTQAAGSFGLRKTSDTWMLTSPIAARADKAAVESLLAGIDSARKKDPFDVEAGKLGDYGLDSPVVSAEVKASGKNYVEKFSIGAETSDNAEVYVRVGESNKIYTVPTSVKTALVKPAAELRDKRLLPANINEATSITLAFDGQQFALGKRGTTWFLEQPQPGRADMDRVSEILREWNNARALDFIDTKTLDLARYGLDAPAWRGSVLVAGEAPRTSASLRTLLIGKPTEQDATKRYAMAEGEPVVFTLQDTLLPKVQPTLDALRSKQAFTLASDQVGRMSFNTRGKQMTLVKDSTGSWRLADDPASKLDQSAVSTKLTDLLALKAQRFVTTETEPTVTGLGDPNLVVTLSNTAGTTTETLATGRKADNEDIVFARLGGAAGPDGAFIALNWQDPGKFFITREDLIDKNLFDFDTEAVRKVEISEGTRTLTLTRAAAGGTWSAKLGSTEKTIEPAQANALLFATTSLAWTRTLNLASENDKTLVKTQNLEKPARSLTFMDEVGNKLGQLGIGGEDERHTYVRKGADAYYAIDKARLLSLSDALRKLISTMETQK